MFLQVFLVGLLAGISPGPDFVVVMRNSLGFGARVGAATALGISMALILHVSYAILGFALLLASYPAVYHFIQVLGAAYLAWLGYGALKAGAADSTVNAPLLAAQAGHSVWQGIRDGFFCNVLNPKAPLFFLSIFSQFITPATPEWVRWIYGLEVVVAVGGWFAFLSYVIDSERFRLTYSRYEVWVNRLLGVILLYFALRITITVIL